MSHGQNYGRAFINALNSNNIDLAVEIYKKHRPFVSHYDFNVNILYALANPRMASVANEIISKEHAIDPNPYQNPHLNACLNYNLHEGRLDTYRRLINEHINNEEQRAIALALFSRIWPIFAPNTFFYALNTSNIDLAIDIYIRHYPYISVNALSIQNLHLLSDQRMAHVAQAILFKAEPEDRITVCQRALRTTMGSARYCSILALLYRAWTQETLFVEPSAAKIDQLKQHPAYQFVLNISKNDYSVAAKAFALAKIKEIDEVFSLPVSAKKPEAINKVSSNIQNIAYECLRHSESYQMLLDASAEARLPAKQAFARERLARFATYVQSSTDYEALETILRDNAYELAQMPNEPAQLNITPSTTVAPVFSVLTDACSVDRKKALERAQPEAFNPTEIDTYYPTTVPSTLEKIPFYTSATTPAKTVVSGSIAHLAGTEITSDRL